MLTRRAAFLATLLLASLLGACGSSEPIAVVNGVEVTGERLDEMSPTDARDSEAEIRDLNLLILHEILTTRAESEFGLVASEDEIAARFDERVRGRESGIEEWLADRGSTPDRVMLEAELDVIRAELEDVMAESDDYGFDFDAAYRYFLSVNSRVCLQGLTIPAVEAVDEIERAVEDGTDVAGLAAAFPDATQELEIGCNIPVEFGPLLAPVALDADLGVAVLRETAEGTTFVVEVTERDAPAADEVRDEVIELGRERQAPGLFDAWVVELLRSAEVEVDESVGVWGATAEGDIPTVTPTAG